MGAAFVMCADCATVVAPLVSRKVLGGTHFGCACITCMVCYIAGKDVLQR